jgi:hydrogenase small subunit
MSFLNAEEPSIIELTHNLGIEILWHPSLSVQNGREVAKIFKEIVNSDNLDILVIEGAIARGPNGTGRYHMFAGRPFKDIVSDMAKVARFVIALGACACWGGIPASGSNPTGSTGVQFHKSKLGGFLGKRYRSKSGLPVINIPGCPAHPSWIAHVLATIAQGREKEMELDSEYNRPAIFFSTLAHEGCDRALYHEYKMAAEDFGHAGCLFFELGCRGPITFSSCNEILWNKQSSKPRAGVPCVGCTDPDFPDYPEPGFFRRYAITPNIGVKMLPYLISTPFCRLVAPGMKRRE